MGTDISPVQASTQGILDKSAMHWRMILIVAILARFLFAFIFFDFSRIPPMEGRGFENVAIALSIHSGHGFSSPFYTDSGPTAFMTPIYPGFMAAVMLLFGTGSMAATIIVAVQELFSVGTVLLAMYIGRNLFTERAANMAGLFCALAPPMLSAPLLTWDACLSAFTLTALFAAASSRLLSSMRFVPAGAFCAVGGLLNPTLIPALWAICGWAAWKARRFPWAGVLSFCVVLSPWLIRNALVMHAFIPLRPNFGYELWQGNHPGASGDFNESMNPMMDSSERHAFSEKGEIAYFHEKGALARQYIAAHPSEFLRLSAKRLWQFWTLSQDGAAASTIPILLLALVGLVLAAARRGLAAATLFALPLVLYPLPYYITHVYARFEWVIEPLLLILAGYTMSRFLEWLRPEVELQDT
jgi:hypothetical protein